MTDTKQKTALVVSAHAADFVWRAGGAIALHARRGYRVRIVCLSYGERGESAGASNRKLRELPNPIDAMHGGDQAPGRPALPKDTSAAATASSDSGMSGPSPSINGRRGPSAGRGSAASGAEA